MRQTDLETRHLPGYHGFSIYGTAPILPEHLQFCEEQQQGVVNLSQAPNKAAAAVKARDIYLTLVADG
jgi:hypothetical protein